jgi:two-component system, cell cycle response regulator DivK
MRPIVLIIDDEPAVLELVSEFLTLSSYRVYTASGETEALLAVARMDTPPTAVFVNLHRGRAGAAGTIRRLRGIPRLAATRFVALVGGDAAASSSAALAAECEGFIGKPFRMSDFIPFIDSGSPAAH